VIGQVWRDGSAQVRLGRLLKSGLLDVRELDLDEARAAGSLCGIARTADAIDASVVLLARRFDAAVVTTDDADLRALDRHVSLIAC
jgi:hypothetical protein